MRRRPRGSEQLLDDHLLVATQLPVVPAVRDVPQRDRRVLVGQRPAQVGRVDRAADRLDLAAGGRHDAAYSRRVADLQLGRPRGGATPRPTPRRAAARSSRGPVARTTLAGSRRPPRCSGGSPRRAARRASAAVPVDVQPCRKLAAGDPLLQQADRDAVDLASPPEEHLADRGMCRLGPGEGEEAGAAELPGSTSIWSNMKPTAAGALAEAFDRASRRASSLISWSVMRSQPARISSSLLLK